MKDDLGIIHHIFDTYNSIAVYGMSKEREKAANNIPKYLKSKGFEIIPINPNHQEILGLKCYPSLLEIEKPVEIVEVFRPSNEAMKITGEAILRKSLTNDIQVIWLQKGITSNDNKKNEHKTMIFSLFRIDVCLKCMINYMVKKNDRRKSH